MFLKAPRPGLVKVRLAAAIGPEAASAAYRQLVERLLASLGRLDPVQLCFTPDDAVAEIQPWLAARWTAAPQGDGDLGARLERAFDQAFAAEARRVVIIGSDCPDIAVPDIEAAWAALRESDVVLGPATDGGYWLVGLRAPQPQLFRGIPWSTAAVLTETLARARLAGLSVHLLRALSDVDTVEDWKSFLTRDPAHE